MWRLLIWHLDEWCLGWSEAAVKSPGLYVHSKGGWQRGLTEEANLRPKSSLQSSFLCKHGRAAAISCCFPRFLLVYCSPMGLNESRTTDGSSGLQLSPSSGCHVRVGNGAGRLLEKRLAYESPSRERQRELLAANLRNVTSVIAQTKSFQWD